jgi:cell division septation protein DedD
MVNDIKIPDFNLDDQFSIDGENASKSAPKKADTAAPAPPPTAPPKAPKEEAEAAVPAASKPKPKLLFEEDEGMDNIMTPPLEAPARAAREETSKDDATPPPRRERQKREKDESEEPANEKVQKERTPIKINKKILIISVLVILLGGGAYFAYTNGLFGAMYSKVSGLKNSFFAADTLSVVVTDSLSAADTTTVTEEGLAEQQEQKELDLYESQFLRQPAASQAAKPAEAEKAKTTVAATPQTATTAAPAKPAAATTAAGKTSGKYSIQVSAWQSQSVARTESRKIINKGLTAQVVSANLGQKGIWYRVMVGSYSTQGEAERDLSRVLRIAESESGIIREN